MDIITGRLISSSSSASKAALLGRGSAVADRTPRTALGGSEGSALPPGPQVVLRGGRWELVGHEDDMKGLQAAVPTLQARLTAGVKAEQVSSDQSCLITA
jgi:hypothetical protein